MQSSFALTFAKGASVRMNNRRKNYIMKQGSS